MLRLIGSLVITASLALGVASITTVSPALASDHEKAAKPDWKNIQMHLKEHQKFPATKAELVASCNSLSDFSEADKKWFAETLPDGTYKSAGDVVKALKKSK